MILSSSVILVQLVEVAMFLFDHRLFLFCDNRQDAIKSNLHRKLYNLKAILDQMWGNYRLGVIFDLFSR